MDNSNYKSENNSEKNFLTKFKKIIIEIIIIIFSVYVSIWLSNWNEYKKQQAETKEFLIDLKSDLETDVKNFIEEKTKLDESKNGINTLLKLTPKQIKNIGRLEMKVQFNTRRNIEANYEGFKSTGKIGNIEDKKLKKNVISYYQEYLSVTTEVEKDLNSSKKEIIELLGKNNFESMILDDPYFRTKLEVYLGTVESLSNAYNEDINKAKETIKNINKYVQ